MERIGVASAEQARGVIEMTASIQQLDTATQHNAAFVEQSVAAASALEQEAAAVLGLLSGFKVTASA